jgi:hypothetical protein
MSTPSLIAKRLQDIPVRSPRGNEIIRRDPRELPRRLRGLLLAINGQQTVAAYVHTLAGFGDVVALMNELLHLGLIELRSRGNFEIRPEAPAPTLKTTTTQRVNFDESSFNSSYIDITLPPHESPGLESAFENPAELMGTLYDSTVRGSFDDLVRETQRTNPEYQPAPSPPPLTPETKSRQLDSLFNLLEQVRRERQALRQRVDKLRKYRDRSRLLAQENKRLTQAALALVVTCGALVAVVLMLAIKR